VNGCAFARDDGAYVLGALAPVERVAFERHLGGCGSCARSVRELAGLPGLLVRVPPESLDLHPPSPPLPDTLLPSLLHRVRAARRRRTWATAGLVAAVTAAALWAGAALGPDGSTPPPATPSAAPSASPPPAPPTSDPERLAPVGPVAMTGWVSLTPVAWGTRLDLTCSYPGAGAVYPYDPEAPEPTYTLEITRRDGSTEQVASWLAGHGETVHVAAATAAARDEIARVAVRTAGGSEVLRLQRVTG
jgi:anti-sigma factor RsiW